MCWAPSQKHQAATNTLFPLTTLPKNRKKNGKKRKNKKILCKHILPSGCSKQCSSTYRSCVPPVSSTAQENVHYHKHCFVSCSLLLLEAHEDALKPGLRERACSKAAEPPPRNGVLKTPACILCRLDLVEASERIQRAFLP